MMTLDEMVGKAVLVRIKDEAALPAYCEGTAYNVYVEGRLYGMVYQTERESCSYTGRLRYNIRRGKCWTQEASEHLGGGYYRTQDTRKEAVQALLDDWMRSGKEPRKS